MTHSSRALLLTTVAALVGLLSATPHGSAQPQLVSPQEVPPHWRSLFDRLRNFYEVANVRPKYCAAEFTVDFVYLNPHLSVGDKMFVAGPLPGTGNFSVSPIPRPPGGAPWNHPWQNQTFTAYPTPIGPNIYDLPAVGIEPHDNAPNPPGPRSHRYQLEVEQWDDDCPSRVVFHSRGHGGIVVDDPGHAGALR